MAMFSCQQSESSRSKMLKELARVDISLRWPSKYWKLKSLLRFKRSCNARKPQKGHETVIAHKEWKLFKCRLRNVNTIYQDFRTEIIIMSIYEVFLLSLHFSSFSLASLRLLCDRKWMEGRKDMRWKKLSSFRLFLMVSHLSISGTVTAAAEAERNQFSRILLLSKTFCCCLLFTDVRAESTKMIQEKGRKMRQI